MKDKIKDDSIVVEDSRKEASPTLGLELFQNRRVQMGEHLHRRPSDTSSSREPDVYEVLPGVSKSSVDNEKSRLSSSEFLWRSSNNSSHEDVVNSRVQKLPLQPDSKTETPDGEFCEDSRTSTMLQLSTTATKDGIEGKQPHKDACMSRINLIYGSGWEPKKNISEKNLVEKISALSEDPQNKFDLSSSREGVASKSPTESSKSLLSFW